MKNLLYFITGLLILIWTIVFLNYKPSGIVHLLFAVAILAVLISIAFKIQVLRK